MTWVVLLIGVFIAACGCTSHPRDKWDMICNVVAILGGGAVCVLALLIHAGVRVCG